MALSAVDACSLHVVLSGHGESAERHQTPVRTASSELRKTAGFSQEGFAAHLDLDRSYIGGVERGNRNVSLVNIKRIADGLDIEIRELF